MHSPEPPGVDVLGGRWGWVGIGRDRLDINDAFYVFVALPMRSSRGRIVVRVVRAWPLFRFNSLQSRRRYRGLVANCGTVPDIMYLIGTEEDGRGKAQRASSYRGYRDDSSSVGPSLWQFQW